MSTEDRCVDHGAGDLLPTDLQAIQQQLISPLSSPFTPGTMVVTR